jgi:micrococcal nuclease
MIQVRYASLVLTVLAVIGFTIGSSGFSAIEADRNVHIDAVSDTKANLGITNENGNTMESNKTVLLTLTNQFGTRLTITVQTIEKNDILSVTIVNSPYKLSQGTSAPVIAAVDCRKPVNSVPVVVHITASDSNVWIMMNRTVQVSCTPKQKATPSGTASTANTSDNSSGSVSSVDRESVLQVTITRVNDENTTIQTLTPTNTTPTTADTTTQANTQLSITETASHANKNTASSAVNHTIPTRVINESEDVISPTPAPISAPTSAPTATATQTDTHPLSPSDTLSPSTPVNTSTQSNETTPTSRPTETPVTTRTDTQTPPTTETSTPIGTRTDPPTPANTTTPSQIPTSPTQVPTSTPPSTGTNTQSQTTTPIQSSMNSSLTNTTTANTSSGGSITAMNTSKGDLSPVSPIENGTARYATITRVIDGDTFEVEFVDGGVDTIRLVGVDTPEAVAANVTPSEYSIPNSSRGRDWLRRWNENAQIFIKNITTNRVLVVTDPTSEIRDDAGRLLAYVYYGTDQNTNLGRTLLDRGLARQNDNVNYTLKNEYRQLEQNAQTTNRGLWAFETRTTAGQTRTTTPQMRMTTHASSNASPLPPTSNDITNPIPISENTTLSTPTSENTTALSSNRNV